MDEILKKVEELKKLTPVYQQIMENSKELDVNKVKTLKLKEKIDNNKIHYIDRAMNKSLYEKRVNAENSIHESLLHYVKKLHKEFESQRKALLDEINKEIKKIETKYAKDVETKNTKKIESLQKEKAVYEKIAQNTKKDIDNILNEINSGNIVNATKLSDIKSEYQANKDKISKIEKELTDIKNIDVKDIDVKDIADEKYEDLKNFRARIGNMKEADLEKFESDEFLTKYEKQEDKEEKDNNQKDLNNSNEQEKPNGEQSKNEENNEITPPNTNEQEKPKDEQSKNEENNEITPPNTSEQEKPKDEQNKSEDNKEIRTIADLYDEKGKKFIGTAGRLKFVMDVSNKKLKVNDNDEKIDRKTKRELKKDSFLAIKSYFYKDKNIKNIDYTVLAALNRENKNLAMDYLNVIRGGGIKGFGTAEESLARLKDSVQFKYQFKKGLKTFFDIKDKKIAREAKRLGLAELEGISEKGLLDTIKDKVSKTKMFKAKEQPKLITSGENKTRAQLDKEKTIARIREDRTNGSRILQELEVNEDVKKKLDSVSKKYNETENEITNEIGKDVKRIVAEDNKKSEPKGTEIGD